MLPMGGLHESVIVGALLPHLDARSKCSLRTTCRALRDLLGRPEHWRRVVFEDAEAQRGLGAPQLTQLLKLSGGGVEELMLAR